MTHSPAPFFSLPPVPRHIASAWACLHDTWEGPKSLAACLTGLGWHLEFPHSKLLLWAEAACLEDSY